MNSISRILAISVDQSPRFFAINVVDRVSFFGSPFKQGPLSRQFPKLRRSARALSQEIVTLSAMITGRPRRTETPTETSRSNMTHSRWSCTVPPPHPRCRNFTISLRVSVSCATQRAAQDLPRNIHDRGNNNRFPTNSSPVSNYSFCWGRRVRMLRRCSFPELCVWSFRGLW